MSVEPQVIEHVTSRGETFGLGNADGDAELFYHVIDCPSSLLARNLVRDEAPAEYHDLGRGPMAITPLGGGIYAVKVKYGGIQDKITMTFDSTCEKIKRMHSLATIANVKVRYTGNELTTAPDFKGLIGVGKDKIEGVEVYDPGSFKFTFQWTSKYKSFDANYIYTVMGLGATVNVQPLAFTYRDQQLVFERGSLLFIGGTFRDSSDGDCDVNLKFEGRLGEDTIRAGDMDGQIAATFTGTTTASNTTMASVSSTDDLRGGMAITGPGIPAGTIIAAVFPGNEIELSQAPTASGTFAFTARNPYLPAKEGWHYIWTRTVKHPDRVHGVEVEVADSAHIEQVYGYSNFGLLRIFDVINIQEDILEQQEEEQQEQEEEEVNYEPLPENFGSTFPVQG